MPWRRSGACPDGGQGAGKPIKIPIFFLILRGIGAFLFYEVFAGNPLHFHLDLPIGLYGIKASNRHYYYFRTAGPGES